MESTAAAPIDPREPATRERIQGLRAAVRLRDARPNDGRCGAVSQALAAEFGWQRECGYLRLLDNTVSWVHCWNRLDDGTVVDATADQFQDLWLGATTDITMLDPTDPRAANYLPAPQAWELRLGGAGGRLECRSGTETVTLTAEDPAHPWRSLAELVLELITGWSLADEVVDLAARTLRARADNTEWLSGEDFTHVLLIASIQHLGQRGGQPWIAPEFRAEL